MSTITQTITHFQIDEPDTPLDPDHPYRLVLTGDGIEIRPSRLWAGFGETYAGALDLHPDGRTLIGWIRERPADGEELTIRYSDEPAVGTGLHYSST